MARSHSIHIVTHGKEGFPIRAFTVRYECSTWLQRQTPEFLSEVYVITFYDGGGVLRDYERADEWIKRF